MSKLDSLEIAKKMAGEIKDINKQLNKFIGNSEYQGLATKELLNHLMQADKQIGNYRSKIEDRLLAKGIIDSIDIFY